MSKSSKRDAELAARVERVVRACVTYGEIERAAGVTDRAAFWKGKSEEQARAVLREMIATRLLSGELKVA
jgi:hypothetical protein